MTNEINITAAEIEAIKQKIVALFDENVRGKKSDTIKANVDHDGKDGHWLETAMGIDHNADNEPDLWGFEMKNETTSKTTFGDWSAEHYIYTDKEYFPEDTRVGRRDNFMTIFGSPNEDGRYSWSGSCFPKVGSCNNFGQEMIVDAENNVTIYYSYSKDERENKEQIVPEAFRQENLVLATWSADFLRNKVESKFNILGWFKCKKDPATKEYSQIVFGGPINYEFWIDQVKNNVIYLDSAMHVGNFRPYSNWRASNKYWDTLIIDSY